MTTFKEGGFPREIKHDEIRTKYIHGLKLRIVRFENCEVFENPDRVLQEIRKYFR